MSIQTKPGIKKSDLLLFALSTCIWCRKTKQLLDELGVEYSYVFMDLIDKDKKEELKKQLEEWNPKCSFPTLVVNKQRCIIGFNENEIKKAVQ